MTWIIILGILIIAFTWLLIAPLYLYVSTSESRYEAGLAGIFKVLITMEENGLPTLTGKIFFITFNIPVFKFRKKKIKASTSKKSKKKARKLTRKRLRLIMSILWKIIHSFKLRQLKLNIDTTDVIRNAYLIPAFSMAYRNNIQLSVNYEDKNEFILHLENNLVRIIIKVISSFIKNHIKK